MKIDFMYLPLSAMFIIGMAIGYTHKPIQKTYTENNFSRDTIYIIDTFYVDSNENFEIPIHVKTYIDRFLETAKREQSLYGIPASIKLAQAMLESDYGRSLLAKNGKNHFGIKSRSWDYPIADQVNGNFRAYDDCDGMCKFQRFKTDWASWRAHSIILQGDRYSRLNGVSDYKEYANILQDCGYATNQSYARKIISIINKYGLYRYDA